MPKLHLPSEPFATGGWLMSSRSNVWWCSSIRRPGMPCLDTRMLVMYGLFVERSTVNVAARWYNCPKQASVGP